MSADKNTDNHEIELALKADSDEMGSKQRFGYFSIIYSAYLGDKYYSQDKQRTWKKDGKKVITEKRGIFTNPPKKGKNQDALFLNMYTQQQEMIDKIKHISEEESKKYLTFVKERSEKQSALPFKPNGPQEYRDFFSKEENLVEYKIPIDKPKQRTVKLDANKKVITERRGVVTNPTKTGNSTTPGVLFSYFSEDHEKLRDLAKSIKKNKPEVKKEEKSGGKLPFKPASIMKNEAFASIEATYGEDLDKLNNLINENLENRKKGKKAYEPQPIQGAAKHMGPFKPASLIRSGRTGLFHEYIEDEEMLKKKPEVKKVVHDDKKKELFKYNRVMDSSTFSPPISSFTVNMKKEFPRVFK